MENKKIRVIFKAYDHKILDQSMSKVIEIVNGTGAKVKGPVPLPVDRSVYTILKSVHRHKDSREQFEMREHKRIIDIINPTAKTTDQLIRVQLPSGVAVEVKLL